MDKILKIFKEHSQDGLPDRKKDKKKQKEHSTNPLKNLDTCISMKHVTMQDDEACKVDDNHLSLF